MNLRKLKIRPLGFLVFTILVFAFIFRVYRINDFLGFYFDQGRDALVIWDFIQNGRMFLIGPTTGIEGIYRGPWYYWLITPFYWLGGGNPVYPSVFLSSLTVLALFLLYRLADNLGGKITGIIALIIGSFSFTFVSSSRWLSNPTPMYLIGILYIFALTRLVEGRKKYLYWAFLLAGFAMQFGSATEIFYIPSLLIAVLISKRKFKLREILLSLLFFIFPFIPQIIFDIRHGGVLSDAVYKFLVERESFKLSFWQTVVDRLPFYFSVIENKLWYKEQPLTNIFFLIILFSLVINWTKIVANKKILIVLVAVLMPFLGMFFFQGNSGNVYDYYFTGYYLTIVLMLSVLIGFYWNKFVGKVMIIVFVIMFLQSNLPPIFAFKDLSYRRDDMITLANQKEAIDWIYNDSDGYAFNVDVYVPPVIPYAYDYLFLWYGGLKYNRQPSNESVGLLYTLSEADLERPGRLGEWEKRQEGIGKTVKEMEFGLIKVQKRERLVYE